MALFKFCNLGEIERMVRIQTDAMIFNEKQMYLIVGEGYIQGKLEHGYLQAHLQAVLASTSHQITVFG
jgi:hypothetical protein